MGAIWVCVCSTMCIETHLWLCKNKNNYMLKACKCRGTRFVWANSLCHYQNLGILLISEDGLQSIILQGVPIMGWMTMAHVPCFAMAHIDFIKSWLAGLVYWPHAFPLMRIYNGDIHIIYIHIMLPSNKNWAGCFKISHGYEYRRSVISTG